MSSDATRCEACGTTTAAGADNTAATTTAATQAIRFWPARGRLGRARLIAYSAGLQIAVIVGVGLIGAVGMPLLAWPLIVLGVGFGALLLVLRSHDMNLSGWWSLGAVVPLVGLIWLVAPGSKGANRFGPPPVANSIGVLVAAWMVGLIIPVTGVLAAIALPAYNDYTVKAKVSEALLDATECRRKVADAYRAGEPNSLACEANGLGSKYVDHLRSNPDGVIVLTLKATGASGVDARQVMLTPIGADGRSLSARQMPAEVASFACQSTPLDGVPDKYLPSSCRRR